MPAGAQLLAVTITSPCPISPAAELDPSGTFVFRRVPDGTVEIEVSVLLDGATIHVTTAATPGTPVELEFRR
jgi:hypothetical protein